MLVVLQLFGPKSTYWTHLLSSYLMMALDEYCYIFWAPWMSVRTPKGNSSNSCWDGSVKDAVVNLMVAVDEKSRKWLNIWDSSSGNHECLYKNPKEIHPIVFEISKSYHHFGPDWNISTTVGWTNQHCHTQSHATSVTLKAF